jgi:hypothetical protein
VERLVKNVEEMDNGMLLSVEELVKEMYLKAEI